MKINKDSFAQLINAIKIVAKSKYTLIAAPTLLSVGMVGYIFILPMYDNAPAPKLKTYSFQQVSPTDAPALISLSPEVTNQNSTDLNSENPTVLPTSSQMPTTTVDPTTAWPTYSNSQYGYTIKYPPNWSIQNLSPLEPNVPSYIVFNQNTVSSNSRSITITVSNRTYQEQLSIGGPGSSVRIASITGTQEYLLDSNGNQSVTIILPRSNNLILLHSKLTSTTIFNQMLQTFKLTN